MRRFCFLLPLVLLAACGTGDGLIDFDGDVYGRRVDLAFEHRLRAEKKFDGPHALREQIERDVDAAREWLGRA